MKALVSGSGKARKLKHDILFQKGSECKHSVAVSCGVVGNHYSCSNKVSRQYGILMPMCSEQCFGFEK